jgi:hypothetical protein
MTSAQMIRELATYATIDPYEAAVLLGVPILSVDQVSDVRCEYQLGANEQFTDITAIVGGHDNTWRVLDLVPREMLLDPLILLLPTDTPYTQRPLVKHTNDGPVLVGIEHHFVVEAGELVIATRNARVERVTLMAR